MQNKWVALATMTLLLASPLLWADGQNISKINGSIRVESGRQVGSVETVNGSIRLEDSVQAGDIETVSGSIDIGRDATVGDIETVNGGVTLGRNTKADSIQVVNGRLRLDEQVEVRGNVTNVNGGITLAKGARIGGHLENVNGNIEVQGATIGAGIRTTTGDIEIGSGSRVDGGIHVAKPNSVGIFSNKRKPRITIGPDAVVNGTLKFDREVELRISDRATVGKIVGATPIKE
ncbi:hypothetical protein [Steroidobacter cummioxidans]|uniref:hypothetical protein n=1 Tax=Steroidobacter cummioxidans TaxID=1803913 RepID=UPI0019D4A134|nr:hypothetical protein [Steroidobacter cummioxidans]